MDHCGGRGGTPRKEAVPRAGDVARLAPRTGRDFVAANRMQVRGPRVRKRGQSTVKSRCRFWSCLLRCLIDRSVGMLYGGSGAFLSAVL